ncbi:MAG: helix-turn-helix transcriptional regulator [Spirochaetota bacterium]
MYPTAFVTLDRFLASFGRMVSIERMNQGLSQERLAEFADLHRNSIQKIEQGRDNMLLESITSLCLSLGISRIGLDYENGFVDYSGSGTVFQDPKIQTVSQKLGIMLETMRKEHGISRERMSDQIGIHRNTITRIENGRTEIRFGTLLLFYSYFGISEVRRVPPHQLPENKDILYGVSIHRDENKRVFHIYLDGCPMAISDQ